MQQKETILEIIGRLMGLTPDDEIIPGRGEPSVDPTTKETHVRFTRGDKEYHLRVIVEEAGPRLR